MTVREGIGNFSEHLIDFKIIHGYLILNGFPKIDMISQISTPNILTQCQNRDLRYINSVSISDFKMVFHNPAIPGISLEKGPSEALPYLVFVGYDCVDFGPVRASLAIFDYTHHWQSVFSVQRILID